MAAEADHRIANSLSVIASLVRVRASKGRGTADPAMFLKEIAERIDTVGKLHHHIARSQTGAVQLDAYLEEICQRLKAALGTPATSFSIACPPTIVVPFTVALPLGLMAAELFSNSLKYAHPAGLPVKIGLFCAQAAPDELTVVFEDDGVGFPEDFDTAHDGHLGMRFIRLLSDQLGGAPNWLSDPLGIRFEMTAKLSCVDQTGATAPETVALPGEVPLHG
jgi:two-component sensor histidine kinase